MIAKRLARDVEDIHVTKSGGTHSGCSFNHTRSLIPNKELRQTPPHPDSTNSEYVSPEPSSDYQPSLPPLESPTAEGCRVPAYKVSSQLWALRCLMPLTVAGLVGLRY